MTSARQPERESTPEWLESELREAKARLHKVEGELAQALKQFWSLDADVKKMRDTVSASAPVSGLVHGFREEVRQLQDQLSRLQDRQAGLAEKTEHLLRKRQAETGRERPEVGLVSKQVEGVARALEQQEARMRAMEELARQVEEDVAGERLARQALERTLADSSSRIARVHENLLRLDQQASGWDVQLEKLRGEDEAQAEQLKLLAEQVRRTAERVEKLENISGFPEEVRELLQAASFERDQLLQRFDVAERAANEMADRIQESLQVTARLDQRTQTQAGQLLSLTTQQQDLSEQLNGTLKKLYQVLLRQRRRQAEALAQEIKELSQGGLYSGD